MLTKFTSAAAAAAAAMSTLRPGEATHCAATSQPGENILPDISKHSQSYTVTHMDYN